MSTRKVRSLGDLESLRRAMRDAEREAAAAAARAQDQDIVPQFKERYDLVIPRAHYESALLRPLLEVLADGRFRQQVAALPGYDVRHMGQIAAEL